MSDTLPAVGADPVHDLLTVYAAAPQHNYPTMRTLARDLGWTKPAVRRALHELRASGRAVVTDVPGRGPRWVAL